MVKVHLSADMQPDLTKHQKLAALTVNGAQLSEMALDFTLPGYDIELVVRPLPGPFRRDLPCTEYS